MNTFSHHDVIRTPALGTVDVFEDLIPESLRRNILRLVRRPIWAYGWKSIKEHDRYGFWHAHFAGGDEASRDNCEESLAANVSAAPIHELWKYLSTTVLQGHVPLRVYANGHTYGVEGYVHTDSDDTDYFTTIYYAHGVWDQNWAGETVFFSEATNDITHAVMPEPGRVIMFCGATPHVARSVSRECPELRISIVIKTRLK
ncbi:MAG: hypothetical protein ACREPV_00640 [Lysobacter sp.]